MGKNQGKKCLLVYDTRRMEMNDRLKNEAYQLALSDIQGLAWKWCKTKYIKEDNMLDRDDIEQEISIAFFRALDTYEDQSFTFRTYYNRVIFNHMMNFVRAIKARRPDGISIESLDVVDDYMTASLDVTEKAKDILKVLQTSLSDRDYEIVVLYYGVGLPAASTLVDIERLTGVPNQTASRIIKKALDNKEIKDQLRYLQ